MTAFRTISIDGLDSFYQKSGSPDNPTILL
jgi:hypothetical protein